MLVTVRRFIIQKGAGHPAPILLMQQAAINHQVFILEHVEDDLDIAVCCFFILFYGVDSDLCRLPLRETEHAGGDTAERDAFHAVLLGKPQT